MNERGHIYIERIWLVLIVIVVVALAVIGIILVASKVMNAEPKTEMNNIVLNDIINNNVKDYTRLDEGIAQQELPKVEINVIAEKNSTIDGRKPCFYNPIIPAGFKAVGNVQDKTISENAKWGDLDSYLNGLVIEDKAGNQFVWIPVENMEIFKTTDWQKNVPTGKISANYVEPKEDEEEAYYQMYYKVKKYGGFYIGRYETGDATATSERTKVKNSDSIGIRKYLNTYNYVPYTQTLIEGRQITGANELAINFKKQMGYKEDIETSVMYGVQWDAVLRFVVSDTYNVNNSARWGNYSTTEIKYTDINGNTNIKQIGEDRLLKAGASEDTKAKNIYDIAGNLYEWTKEASGAARVVRGGCYVVKAGQLAAFRYGYNENTANNAIGFRISFYVN